MVASFHSAKQRLHVVLGFKQSKSRGDMQHAEKHGGRFAGASKAILHVNLVQPHDPLTPPFMQDNACRQPYEYAWGCAEKYSSH